MANYRLSLAAAADVTEVLAVSIDRWGLAASRRYAEMLTTAMRQVADHPDGRLTRARSDLASGVRSFHLRHARQLDPRTAVKRPVHVLIYRTLEPGLVQIVRVLHERLDLRRYVGQGADG